MGPPQRYRLSTWFFLVIMVADFCWSASLHAVSSTELSEGISYYSSGQYIRALASFDRVVSFQKKNALAHYYRANALMYLSQREDALEEYKIAYSLAPAHSQMAGYCMAVLQADEQRQDEDSCKAERRRLIRQMVTQIQGQVARQKNYLDSGVEIEASHHSRLQSIEEQRIREQTDREIETMMNNPIAIVVRGRVVYISRTEEADAVRKKSYVDCQESRQRAERAVSANADESNRRQMELEKAAINLENQALKISGGGVRLSVLGTNLYVRNYAIDANLQHDDYLPVPLVAKAKRLQYIPLKQ